MTNDAVRLESPGTQLHELWMAYRREGVATCVRCRHRSSLVAAVRDEPHAYQLSCSRCGSHTPWFECKNGRLAFIELDRFGRPM